MIQFPYTLAAIDDWLGLAIFAVIAIGGWAVRTIREVRAEQEAKRRRLEAQNSAAPAGVERADAGRVSAEQLAARRRQELERLARGKAPSASPSPQTEPNNLTLQEMRERAQAKAEYERRAAALREEQDEARRRVAEMQRAQQQRQSARPAAASTAPPTSSPMPQRMPPPAQRPPGSQGPVRRTTLAGRSAARPAQAPSRRPAASPSAPAATSRPFPPQESEPVRTPLPVSTTNAADGAAKIPIAAVPIVAGQPMTAKSLRQAVILREIMDPPLSLRTSPDSL